jgi:hypothetical protein
MRIRWNASPKQKSKLGLHCLWFYADAHAYLNDALPERESRIHELKRLKATGNEEVLSVLLDSTSAQAR